MMKAKIVEIFRSIQGEGKYTGYPQVFVRLFECNMHCVWCDTPNSIGDTIQRYDEYTVDELLKQVDNAWDEACHSVSITGGEPLIQSDFLFELCRRLKEEGKEIHLDTNGTLPHDLEKIVDYIDTIAMDIKLPSSTAERAYWNEHEEFLKIAHHKDLFVKIVVSSKTSQEDLDQAKELIAGIDDSIEVFMQPNYFDRNNGVVQKCIDWQAASTRRLKNLRILPQTHKMLKVR